MMDGALSFYEEVSSSLVFSRSAATPSAELPLVVAPFSEVSASRRSISFLALSMFCERNVSFAKVVVGMSSSYLLGLAGLVLLPALELGLDLLNNSGNSGLR